MGRCDRVSCDLTANNAMSDSIGGKEFPSLVNELADLHIGKVKSLVVQLGVSLGECDNVDYVPVEERRQKLLGYWLKVDESATWSKLVDALKTPAVNQHSLAKKIREKYCASSQRPPLIRKTAISEEDERRSCEFLICQISQCIKIIIRAGN